MGNKSQKNQKNHWTHRIDINCHSFHHNIGTLHPRHQLCPDCCGTRVDPLPWSEIGKDLHVTGILRKK